MTKQLINTQDDQWEEGSTNVFADLGMIDAEEKLAKVELALNINQILKTKNLTQTKAATLLGIDQSKISLLKKGRLSGFSIERLVKFLNLLNQDVEIVIRRTRHHSHHGTLRVIHVSS
jgi:predicted XRE-type DNA-binding protein